MEASPLQHVPHTKLIEARKYRQWSQQEMADRLGTTQHTVSRWERGIITPGPYFRAKLCELFGKQAQELGLIKVKPSDVAPPEQEASEGGHASTCEDDTLALWTVPYSRNPHFTGRDDLLVQLARRLSLSVSEGPTSPRRAVLTQAEVLKRLGGIGKTQLAVEYAYRVRLQNCYTHTLRINAANEETILSSFAALTEQLPFIASQEEKDQRKRATAIIHWLEQCQHSWLLIFDNADDLSLVQQYFPRQGNGSLLLTTRVHAVAALASPLEVEPMGVMEGTHFLLHRTQRLDTTDEEIDEATNVVTALDGFPLALDLAGAYIEETGCSFGDYLRLYQNHRQALLARRGSQDTRYLDSVTTTWSLSFQKIEQANPAAADLLRLCAFLAPDQIPEELLREGTAHWPPMLSEAAADMLAFHQMLEDLLKFSLIKRLVKEHMFSLHRLVQIVQRERMDPEEQQYWARCVICRVNAVFPRDPRDEITSWPQCQQYLEQVQACDLMIRQYGLRFFEAADVLHRAAIYLCEQALYTLAEPLFQQALGIWEHLLGLGHFQVAESLSELAELYRRQHNSAEAESLLQRVLNIQEQQLGPHHPKVAVTLNNLAILFMQRALRIREQQLGQHHRNITTLLFNLGILYSVQGNYAEAEPLLQRALHLWEKQLGPQHSLMIHKIKSLAALYLKQDKDAEAESLYQRALHIWEQTPGSDPYEC